MKPRIPDPLHLIPTKSGRRIDIRPILEEMKVLQHCAPWRNDVMRQTVDGWRRIIARDTGSNKAPIELLERLDEDGCLSEPFLRLLRRTWQGAR